LAKPRDVRIDGDSAVSRWCKINYNLAYDVAKSGLTSGWTTGTIDAIASILNLRKDWESVVPIEIRQEPEAQDVQLGPTGKWPKKAVKNYHRPFLVVGIVPTDYYNGKI
jgi:hypothetical protein